MSLNDIKFSLLSNFKNELYFDYLILHEEFIFNFKFFINKY